jgi:hypothetical protein
MKKWKTASLPRLLFSHRLQVMLLSGLERPERIDARAGPKVPRVFSA